MRDFYGDIIRWFMGVVEEVGGDIPKLGRVKVRIYGIHADASEISTVDLPYAQVLVPTTEGGVSGIGQNPNLMVGAQVFGIFLDGASSQMPLVMGSVPKIEVPSNEQVDNSIRNPENNDGSVRQTIDRGILASYEQKLSTSGSNLSVAWGFFTDIMGFSPVATAAILGNFWVESFANRNTPKDLDPQAERKTKAGVVYVYGLAQWEGSRLKDLKQFCNLLGRDISDIIAQLMFVIDELSDNEKSSRGITTFDDVTQAAVFWQHKYERNRFFGEGKGEGGERVTSAYKVNNKKVDRRIHEQERIDAANSIYTQFMSKAT